MDLFEGVSLQPHYSLSACITMQSASVELDSVPLTAASILAQGPECCNGFGQVCWAAVGGMCYQPAFCSAARRISGSQAVLEVSVVQANAKKKTHQNAGAQTHSRLRIISGAFAGDVFFLVLVKLSEQALDLLHKHS